MFTKFTGARPLLVVPTIYHLQSWLEILLNVNLDIKRLRSLIPCFSSQTEMHFHSFFNLMYSVLSDTPYKTFEGALANGSHLLRQHHRRLKIGTVRCFCQNMCWKICFFLLGSHRHDSYSTGMPVCRIIAHNKHWPASFLNTRPRMLPKLCKPNVSSDRSHAAMYDVRLRFGYQFLWISHLPGIR
nr:MAG TPA: hypothetical protein [Caudoviricetes sp.]